MLGRPPASSSAGPDSEDPRPLQAFRRVRPRQEPPHIPAFLSPRPPRSAANSGFSRLCALWRASAPDSSRFQLIEGNSDAGNSARATVEMSLAEVADATRGRSSERTHPRETRHGKSRRPPHVHSSRDARRRKPTLRAPPSPRRLDCRRGARAVRWGLRQLRSRLCRLEPASTKQNQAQGSARTPDCQR